MSPNALYYYYTKRSGYSLHEVVCYICDFALHLVEKQSCGLRASRSRRCAIMAPATMAGPTKGKEACLGTVGEA